MRVGWAGALLCGLVLAGSAAAEPRVESREPYSLWLFADHLKRQGHPEELARALPLFETSLNVYLSREGEATGNAAAVLASIAATERQLGRLDDAVGTSARRVAMLRRGQPASHALADALADLGRDLAASLRHEAARESFAEARTLYAATVGENSALIANLFIEEGIVHYRSGERDAALGAYAEAVRRYGAAPDTDPTNAAIALSNIAGLLTEMNRLAEADVYRATQIEVLRVAAPEGLDLAWALKDRGQIQQTMLNYAEAVKLYGEARALFAVVEGTETERMAELFNNEAVALEALKDYDGALAAYEDSLRLYEKTVGAESGPVAFTLASVTRLNNLLARYADAERAAKRGIAIYRRIEPFSDRLGYLLQELCLTYQKLSRFRDSLAPVREARAMFLASHADMTTTVGDTYLNEGISEEGLENFDAALRLYDEATRRYRAAQGPDSLFAAYALNNTAWVFRRTERFTEADTAFREAHSIMERQLGPTHVNTTKAQINIGIVAHQLGRHDEAIRWSMRALNTLRQDERGTLDDQRWVYDTLATAFAGKGDRRRAILFAKLAINAQQKIRANNKSYAAEELREFKDEWRFLYQDLADLLIAEGRLGEAQAVLDMEKEEELVDFIRRDASADLRDSRAPFTTGEEKTLDALPALASEPIAAATALTALIGKKAASGISADEEAEIAELEGVLDDAYGDYMDEVDAFLASTESENDAVRMEVEAINLDYTADAQEELRALGGRAAMLQVASLGDTLHLFLTVPDASVHREVAIGREALSRLVFDALDAISRRDPEAKARLRSLHEVLVAPVAADLRASGADTLMLNLQGFLRYVPFAALHDGERFLIEDYALAFHTPAARTEFRASERLPERSAGFGVTASHPGFSPLPGVRRELQAIFGSESAVGALAGTAALDDGFTRDSFRAALKSRPAIVHIASHFKLVPGRETDSFLLLGDGSPLSLADIRKGRGFRFGGVDLLTLSACETARGGEAEGDEVESFGALAQMNGASAVMATLWPVADEATAEIMRSFYRHLMTPGVSKAEALRLAQVEAIQGASPDAAGERGAQALRPARRTADPSHPYFWSPFVLMGNWL